MRSIKLILLCKGLLQGSARSGSGYQIHLPLSLYKPCLLCICLSVSQKVIQRWINSLTLLSPTSLPSDWQIINSPNNKLVKIISMRAWMRLCSKIDVLLQFIFFFVLNFFHVFVKRWQQTAFREREETISSGSSSVTPPRWDKNRWRPLRKKKFLPRLVSSLATKSETKLWTWLCLV